MRFEMKDSFWKRFIFALLGIAILGSGVGLSIKANVGLDAFNSFCTGFSDTTGFTVGQANAIFSVLMLAVMFFVNRRVVGIITITNSFLCQFPIDFAFNHFVISDSYIINMLIYIAAQAITCFGASMIVRAELGATIYDGFAIGLSEKINVKYLIVKYATDGIFLVLALMFKGPIGLGTIVSYLVGGVFMKFFMDFMNKHVKF